MSFQTILFEQRGKVGVITLNRPEALNALNIPLFDELRDCLISLRSQEDVAALVITGAGRAFCAGGDVRAMREAQDPGTFLEVLALKLHNVISLIRRLPKPVIAAVNGVAAGAGFPLALSCDTIIASEEARFTLSYVNIGLSPDGGSTYFLPRLLGYHRSLYLAFTGEPVDARRGQELGFIQQVVSGSEVVPAALALAERLASGPRAAMALAKELVNRSLGDTLEVQTEWERLGVGRCARTHDFKEGLEAFFAKRKPEFKGK